MVKDFVCWHQYIYFSPWFLHGGPIITSKSSPFHLLVSSHQVFLVCLTVTCLGSASLPSRLGLFPFFFSLAAFLSCSRCHSADCQAMTESSQWSSDRGQRRDGKRMRGREAQTVNVWSVEEEWESKEVEKAQREIRSNKKGYKKHLVNYVLS